MQVERLEKGLTVQPAHPVDFVDSRALFAAYSEDRDFELLCFIWSLADDPRLIEEHHVANLGPRQPLPCNLMQRLAVCNWLCCKASLDEAEAEDCNEAFADDDPDHSQDHESEVADSDHDCHATSEEATGKCEPELLTDEEGELVQDENNAKRVEEQLPRGDSDVVSWDDPVSTLTDAIAEVVEEGIPPTLVQAAADSCCKDPPANIRHLVSRFLFGHDRSTYHRSPSWWSHTNHVEDCFSARARSSWGHAV